MSEKKSFFRATAEDFEKIPGSPIAYWASEAMRIAFSSFSTLNMVAPCKQGIATANNDRFLRLWFEISVIGITFGLSSQHDADSVNAKWLPYNKGGPYRKWYGNRDYVINWKDNGNAIRNFCDDNGKQRSAIRNEEFFYLSSCTWSDISTSYFGARYTDGGTLFDGSGHSCFPSDENIANVLLMLCSKVSTLFLGVINPTMHFQVGNVALLPMVDKSRLPGETKRIFDRIITIANVDWDSYETSWDFKVNPLVALARVNPDSPVSPGPNTIAALYATLREKWVADCEEMRRLETENNRIFIDAYGLQDDLTPDVPWHEITLTCNPWYKYRKNKKKDKKSQGEGEDNVEQVMLTREEKELMSADDFPLRADKEELLRCDTAKDLVSYAVGCMMGRYSLDKPGLILADQGATEADYYTKIGLDKTAAKFAVDEDGIIPILDNDWFQDDIVTRFKEFVKIAFGEKHFLENMTWIEDALGKDIRSYFTKDFYKDHLQRYQNRPIYWLFQSPKGAFRALVYMHRYKPDMVGGVLGYLRSLQTKIDNQLDVAMQVGADESKSASERVRANKDAVKFAKAKKELDEYEKNVLYPLSTERIEIDLDDGVKVNYRKFGSALRKVAALEEKGE